MKLEDDILIENFLKDELSEQEKKAFLERLQTDALFKEQVAMEKQLLDSLGETYWSYATNSTHAKVKAYTALLEREETKQLKLTISKAIETYKERLDQNPEENRKKTSPIIRLRTVIGIAALFLIFCSIFWFYADEKVDYKMVTQKAWDKNIGLDFTVRSNPSNIDKVSLHQALNFYKQQQYDSTLVILQTYDASSKLYKDILVLRALSNYRLHQTQTAFTTLDTLDRYSPAISKWYKGLMYLDQNDTEKAALYVTIPKTSNQEIKLKE